MKFIRCSICAGILVVVVVVVATRMFYGFTEIAILHCRCVAVQEYRKAHAPMFVMFYAPWCGHCKALKPDYVELSENEELDAPLAAVDCTVMVSTCQKYGVSGYPTLKWFPSKDSDKGEDYDGGRTGADILEFIKGGSGAAAGGGGDDVEIDKDEL